MTSEPARLPERGRSRRRLEDERFLRGLGRYVDDIDVPGALHGIVLRSGLAHGRIVAIDVAAAAAMPGVAAILLAADLAADGIGPLPCLVAVATDEPIRVPPRPALAVDRVRHVGDPVAFVVAGSVAEARDAAEAIRVEYADLPAIVDCADALAPGAPLVWEDRPGNVAFRFRKGDGPAVEAAFGAAAHVVELSLENNRVVVAPLEPRGAIGHFDGETGTFRLVLSGQGVHDIRDQLAGHVLHVPADRVEVVCPDVGGGFGAKNVLHPELVLVLAAARRLGRPVRWMSERNEDFLSSVQGRDNRTTGRLALDAEGRFLALHNRTVADMGAYFSALGPVIPTNSASAAQGGVYDVPAVLMEVTGAFTHTVPVDAYRGAGKPEANYLMERLVDAAAHALGIDPVELRRRNMVRSFPHRSALGMQIEAGAFSSGIDVALGLADAAGFPARRDAARAAGRLRGLGFASFLETARGAPGETAGVRVHAGGTVDLLLGTQSNGQGHETSFPQIAADLLGLPVERFRYVQADTREVPRGKGHGGARSLHQGGTALVRAVEAVLARGRALAAQLFQCEPGDVAYAEGAFTAGEGRSIDLFALAGAASEAGPEAAGPDGELAAIVDTDLDLVTFPNGCHVAEVEVDPETGAIELVAYLAVDDYGTLINPMLTEGSVQGGLAQGIGQALHERVVYEAGSGQLLTASFMDYGLPRAADLPPLPVRFNPVPSAANPLGVKGSGQAGAIAAPQTVVNAVLDALRPAGVRRIDMPLTPERVWRALRHVSR